MRRILVVRRVEGKSMLPTLLPGKLVIASGLYRRISRGDLVIFTHQGIDKLKRIKDIRQPEFYALGDNSASSTDSRSFGWLPVSSIKARVIWPKR